MRRAATEHEVVAIAGAAWFGAYFAGVIANPLPLIACAVVVLAAFGLRRPRWLVVSVFLLSHASATRALEEFEPLSSGEWAGVGRLVTDPRPSGLHSWRAEFKLESGERVLLRASGPPSWELERAEAGDQLEAEGYLRELGDGNWYMSRHLLASLTLSRVDKIDGPPGWRLPAEWLRSAVNRGADLVGPERSALYSGLVIGDDRFQPESQRETFRAVGLAHLLAVSGQNVAFALAVAGPFLRRLGLHAGFVATVLVLFWFAIATRLEPSVLRATLTAAIAAWSVLNRSKASGVRVLAIAVAGALVIDPFLVHSIGFSLSVLASAGIIVGSPILDGKLPGPRWMRLPMAVTLSAQLAVAPLLVGTFGPMSVVAIPANLAAGWAAGLVMAWGLSVGVVAGILPETLGRAAQWPVVQLVWWIDAVATTAVRLPLPKLDGAALAAAFGLTTGIWACRYRARLFRWAFVGALIGLLAISVPDRPRTRTTLEGGATYWPSTPTTPSVLVLETSPDGRVIGSLVEQRVFQVDYLILTKGNRTSAQVVADIRRLVGEIPMIGPPQHRVPGATRLLQPVYIPVLDGQLLLRPTSEEIQVFDN